MSLPCRPGKQKAALYETDYTSIFGTLLRDMNQRRTMTRTVLMLALLGLSSAASSSPTSSSSSASSPTSTSTKRDDFSAAASSSHPVYSPSASSSSAYAGSSGKILKSMSRYGTSGSPSYGSASSGYEAQASSTSYQSQPSPNSNLYYYYYPASKNTQPATSGGGSESDYQASAAQSYGSVSSGSGGGYDQSGGSSSGYGPEGSSGYHGSDGGAAYNAAAASYQHQLQAYAANQGGQGGYSPAQYAQLSQLAQQYGPQIAAAQQQYAQYAQAGHQQHGYGGYGSSPAFQGNYETSKKYYGLGSMIMPLLALAGLGLLIPTVTSLSGKKKRSVDDPRANIGDYAERLEKYFKIYRAAVESEECMNRIVCELGDAVSGVRGKAAFLALFYDRIMEKFAPGWMTNKMGVFKSAALTSESTKCVRYKC